MGMKSIKVAIFIWISVLPCLDSSLIAYEPDISIYPAENELAITVPYGSDEGKSILDIKNKSGKDIPIEIMTSELKQEKTGKKAGLQVLCDNKTVKECFVKRSGVLSLQVHASGINGYEKFAGIVTLDARGKKYNIQVSVQKYPPPPAVELVGSEKGKIEITKDAREKNSFNLIFKNPDNGVFRTLEIADFALKDDGESLKSEIKEKSFSLEPGSEKIITVSFKDIPKGFYQGVLLLQDRENKYLARQFTILLKSQYLTFGNFYNLRMFVIFILVFSGGIVSVLLTKCLPISSARRKNRQDIENCRERIESLTAFETELRIKLIVELIKARTLNDNTKIYTPSANDRLKTIDGILGNIHKQLDVREKIRDIYITINSSDTLPFSREQEIRQVLREADASVYAGNLAFAEGRITEAESLQKFDLAEEADLKQHSECLCSRIEELLTRIDEDIDVSHASSDIFMKHLKDDVKRGKKELCKKEAEGAAEKDWKKKELIGKIRELDLKYGKLHIYCFHFLKQAPESLRSNQAIRDKIIAYLRSDSYSDIEEALKYCLSASHGVAEGDIEQSISGGKVCIKHYPADLDLNKPVNFWLDFGDEEINKSPLRDNYRYIWDFEDKTSSTEGKEIFHYFRRRGWLILLRKWFRRNVYVILFGRDSVWKIFSISVRISKRCGGCGSQYEPVTQKIPVKEPIDKEYNSGITFLDILGYTVTFVLSCIIAAVTNFEETAGFKSFKDLLSPFLIGFTLDVSRDKLVSSSKEILSKWKGSSK